MKKTVCSMLGTFVLVCLLVIFPVRVWAAEVTDSEKGITYELTQQTDGSYSVTVTVNQDQTELVIPSSVVGEDGTVYSIQRVEEISWKPEEMNIQKLTFADGIKTIVRSAMSDFVSTENLTVQFPDTLEDVEDGFVIRCDANLTERIVPKWLQDMTPEDGVVYAGKVAIYIPGSGQITLKEGCTKVAHYAALNNAGITGIYIPDSVGQIGGGAFGGCSSLASVEFAENAQITDLDWRAFWDCTALTEISIPDSLTRIGTETFSGCTSLSKIAISENSRLSQVEYAAFGYYPYPYRYIDLSDMVLRNPPVLSGSTGREDAGVPITEIYLPASVLKPYNSGKDKAAGIFAGSRTLKKVTIGAAGTEKMQLPYEAFTNCVNLETVDLGGNVSKIGMAAFFGCTSLKQIDLSGIDSIECCAFAKSGLTEVTIPETTTEIGSFAFLGCTGLESMTILTDQTGNYGGESLMSILGLTAYVSSRNIHSSSVQNSTPIRSNAEFRSLYPKHTALKTLNIGIKDGKTVFDQKSNFAAYIPSLEKVTLPEGMTQIPDQAFHMCFSLKSIDIPTSVKSIGYQAFQFDVGLDVDFSKLTNLESIGQGAFQIIGNQGGGSDSTRYTDLITNGGISNIILPSSLKSIGYHAFFGQRNAKKIVIPESVSSVGMGSFQMIPSMEELEVYATVNALGSGYFNEIFWNERSKSLQKIILGEHYSSTGTANGYDLFYALSASQVEMRLNNLKAIGKGMFRNMENLTSFDIPATVTEIDQAAFMGTKSLKTMTIPEKVETMDVEVFRNSGVKEVKIYNKDMLFKEPVDGTAEDSSSTFDETTQTKVYPGSGETLETYLAIPKNVTIYGYSGSTAEAYAKKNGNPFVAFDSAGKQKVIVSVTARTTENKEVAVDLTGLGEYEQGSDVTVTAKSADGYRFVGWYQMVGNNYSGECLSNKLSYTFSATENTDLAAVYEAYGTVRINIDGGRNFKINGKSYTSDNIADYSVASTVTAEALEDEFAYWVNEYGMIVSRDRKYSFTVTTAATLRAVYNTRAEDKITVIFESYYGQVILRTQIAEGEIDTIQIPSGPTRIGYTFKEWSAGAEQIRAALKAGESVITIKPVYESVRERCEIKVINGSGSGTYYTNDKVTIVADEPKEGYKFSHWKEVGGAGAILSYNKTYQFFAGSISEIEAVYVEDSEAVEAKATTFIESMYVDDTNDKISFVSMSTVPEGCKIIKAGIVATSDPKVGDNVNASNAEYVRGNAWSGNAYRYTWTKKDYSKNPIWYVRGYLVYEDSQGNVNTIYSDEAYSTNRS